MCCGWSARPLARRRCASRAAPASGSTTPANGRGGAGDSSIALRRMFPPPQPAASPGKIEVIEFFSYMCPHCKEFYPLVSTWAAKLPRNVVFRRVPVGFNRPAWINLVRAYYALQVGGDLDKLDGALFHAIHDEHLQLFDEQSLADWVGKNGGHEEQFARLGHPIAAGEVNHPARPGVGGGGGVFHFHRLDHHQPLPGGAPLAHGDRPRYPPAGQGRRQPAARGARRELVCARVLYQQV